DIYCASENIKLEACDDDESMFGYIYCNGRGLMIGSAFSGDAVHLMPGEEISYSVIPINKCPLPWLRVICRREVIQAFLSKVQEQVLQRTDELRTYAADVATLAQSAEHAAAEDFQQIANELEFNTIGADWRAAQVKAVCDSDTAIRAACTM